nr:MAG TPA: hypothetical protein [Caudoviricetes sp.]
MCCDFCCCLFINFHNANIKNFILKLQIIYKEIYINLCNLLIISIKTFYYGF